VDRFLADVGDAPLSASQQLEYNRLMREMEQSTQAYTERRDRLANYAGMAATTVVGVGATVASGGTLAPALLAFAAAGGAAANAGVRYAIRGSSTSLEDVGRDMVTGAVNAGMTVVGGSLGNALRARYVASRGGEAALSWAQRAGAGLVEGAPDGFIGGFAGGFTDTALADGTFRDGLVAGFGRSLEGGLEGAALGTVLGGAVGASMSTTRGPLRRGVPDGSAAGAGEVTIDELASVNNFDKGRVAPVATGAKQFAASTGYRSVEPAAARAYEVIRASTGDVARISRNTGLSESWVRRVKDHVFNRQHSLPGGRVGRFDPDPEMVAAWRRLEAGTHTPLDVNRLRHEFFESRFEGIFRTDWPTAHTAAEAAAERAAVRAVGTVGIDRSGALARFAEVMAPWQRKVFQRPDIDWYAIRPPGVPMAGKTNWEAAVRGYAPGRVNPANGKWDDVILHHANQDPRGAVIETWRSAHGRVPHQMDPPGSWRQTNPEWAKAWLREQAAYWRWRTGEYNPTPTDRLRLPGDP
jgi:hypothetical protein